MKVNLPAVIREKQIDLLEIDERVGEVSAVLLEKLLPGFEEYGLTIPQFYVTHVVLPEDDPNFKRIRELHTVMLQSQVYQAEAAVRTAQAQSETAYRTAQEESKAAIAAAQRKAELERQTTQTEVARREAERKLIEAQAEAQAQRMAGLTEAEVMRAKGYSEKDVLQSEVQKAYAAGLGQMGSNGGGGALGDIAGLGVALGAMSGVIGMTKEAVTPMFGQTEPPAAAAPAADAWDCPCGAKGLTGKFCPECGTPRPAPVGTWDCACGAKGQTGKFCSECGAKRPETAGTWDCSCGQKGISGKFCPECGKKKGD